MIEIQIFDIATISHWTITKNLSAAKLSCDRIWFAHWWYGAVTLLLDLFPPEYTQKSRGGYLGCLRSIPNLIYVLLMWFPRCMHYGGIQWSAVTTRCYITWEYIKHWPRENFNQGLNSQLTPHMLPSRASYGVSLLRIMEKIHRVITAPHCTWTC